MIATKAPKAPELTEEDFREMLAGDGDLSEHIATACSCSASDDNPH